VVTTQHPEQAEAAVVPTAEQWVLLLLQLLLAVLVVLAVQRGPLVARGVPQLLIPALELSGAVLEVTPLLEAPFFLLCIMTVFLR
jgi:hypothetical protein